MFCLFLQLTAPPLFIRTRPIRLIHVCTELMAGAAAVRTCWRGSSLAPWCVFRLLMSTRPDVVTVCVVCCTRHGLCCNTDRSTHCLERRQHRNVATMVCPESTALLHTSVSPLRTNYLYSALRTNSLCFNALDTQPHA